MMNKLLDEIMSRKKAPLIGIIGATTPNKSYSSEIGIGVGYEVREFLNNSNGKVFTGGVGGVGIDAYVGVLKSTFMNSIKNGSIEESKFFILIPKYEILEDPFDKFMEIKIDYHPPQPYYYLSNLSKEGNLDIEYAGEDMLERREILANLSDVLIMVNGGHGTLEESIYALNASKPVIALQSSGGAAETLSLIKDGKNPPPFLKQKYDFDTSNIHIINNLNEIKGLLQKILR